MNSVLFRAAHGIDEVSCLRGESVRQYRILLNALNKFTHAMAAGLAAVGISDSRARRERGRAFAYRAACHPTLQRAPQQFTLLHTIPLLRTGNETAGFFSDAAVARLSVSAQGRCPGASSLPGKLDFESNDFDLSLRNSAKALSAHLAINPGG